MGTYTAGMAPNDVNGFLVAEMLPETVGCEDEELILRLQRLHEDRRLAAKDRLLKPLPEPEFGEQRLPVKFRLLQIQVSN